jgi:hypothetical protein
VVDHRTVVGEDTAHGTVAEAQPVDVAMDVDGARLRDLYVSTVAGR